MSALGLASMCDLGHILGRLPRVGRLLGSTYGRQRDDLMLFTV